MNKQNTKMFLNRTALGKKIVYLYAILIGQKKGLEICLNQIGDNEVAIWGTSTNAIKVNNALLSKRKGRGCKYFIDWHKAGEKINGQKISSPDELLMDEDMSKLYVIFPDYDNLMHDMEILFDMGFSRQQILIWNHLYAESCIGTKKLNVYDIFLGYSRIDVEDSPGFVKFGKENSSYTIVTLGGSTTDPTFGNVRSWSEILYKKLVNMGMNVTILVGGIGGYNSTQELLKLIRDVIPMRPDIVISYSGTNNLPETEGNFVEKHPFIRRYQEKIFVEMHKRKKLLNYSSPNVKIEKISLGMKNDKDSSQYWVDDMRMMHSICEEFGISFYGFMQPHRNYGGYITHPLENCSDDPEYTEMIAGWFEASKKKIAGMQYMTDLSEIFAGQQNLYFDRCHVYEKANEQIASAILRKILPEVRNHYTKEVH